MKKNIIKISILVFSICAILFVGCGDNDFGGDYIATLSLSDDGGTGETLTIDILQAQCKEGTLGVSGESVSEDIYGVSANITLAVAATSAGITLNSYTIEYLPILSEDGTHTLVLPPTLNNLTGDGMGSSTRYFAANSSSNFSITCFSIDQKQEYRNLIGWQAEVPRDEWDSDDDGTLDTYFQEYEIAAGSIYSNLYYSRYTIRVTLHCTTDNGESKSIVVERTAWFGPYDNC